MTAKRFFVAMLAGASLALTASGANAEPAKLSCSASFVQSGQTGSFASADITDGGLDRLYVEMGPARAPMTVKGAGVSGAYQAQSPDLMLWNYMSVYQPAKEWLAPGSVRFDYSGFRLGWPEFRSRGKAVKALKLTVTQGERSMTVDVGPGAKGFAATNRVFAIDFETMLPGPHTVQRVDDHAAWRKMADTRRPISVTLTDPANGKVVARAEIPLMTAETLQPLLVGGVNALREKFKASKCS